MSNLLFVYGTLMKGHYNHKFLGDSEYIGKAATVDDFTMFAHKYFPAITLESSYPIQGELFIISDVTFRDCDHLEGYREGQASCHYQRKVIQVWCDGVCYDAWVYYQTGTPNVMDKLEVGDFNAYLATRR